MSSSGIDRSRIWRKVVSHAEFNLGPGRTCLMLDLECGHKQRRRGSSLAWPYRHRCLTCESINHRRT